MAKTVVCACAAIAAAAVSASSSPAGVMVFDHARPAGFGFFTGAAGRWVCDDAFVDRSGLDLTEGTAYLSKVSVGYYSRHATRVEIGLWTAPLDQGGKPLVGSSLATVTYGWVLAGSGVVSVDVAAMNIPVLDTFWVGVRFLDTAWGAFLNADPASEAGRAGWTTADYAAVPGMAYVDESDIRYSTGMAVGLEAFIQPFPQNPPIPPEEPIEEPPMEDPPVPAPGAAAVVLLAAAGAGASRRRR